MKFEIKRERLVEGLNDVMKAVSSKTTIPILTGIKMDVSTEGMRLTGSDSDITIQTFIPAEGDGKQLIDDENFSIMRLLNFIHIFEKL